MRILGAFYLRLTGTDVDVYRYLEPLYNDYRKLRQKLPDGRKIPNMLFCHMILEYTSLLFIKKKKIEYTSLFVVCLTLIVSEFTLTHVDEVIDELLKKDYSCDIALPRIKKRYPFFFSLVQSYHIG